MWKADRHFLLFVTSNIIDLISWKSLLHNCIWLSACFISSFIRCSPCFQGLWEIRLAQPRPWVIRVLVYAGVPSSGQRVSPRAAQVIKWEGGQRGENILLTVLASRRAVAKTHTSYPLNMTVRVYIQSQYYEVRLLFNVFLSNDMDVVQWREK